MADTKYKLRYLPLFNEDLEQKVVYIAVNLGNFCYNHLFRHLYGN